MRSMRLIAHEARARRLTIRDNEPLMQGSLNRTQMTLFCALEIEQLLPGFLMGHPTFRPGMSGSLQAVVFENG